MANTAASSVPNLTTVKKSRFAINRITLPLFAVAYLSAYGYGNLSQTVASPLWFPDSVLLWALLLTPINDWWLYVAIALPIRFIPIHHPAVPLWFLVATSANDLVKAPFAAYLLRRLPNGSTHPATMPQLAIFLGVGAVAVPVLSAFAGAASRHLLGYGFWASWYQWYLGDALANVVLTPALLYWSSKHFRAIRPRNVELAVWISGFALSLLLALRLAHSAYSPIAFCVTVPFLIWAATRFGLIGASTSLSVIALLATAGIAEKIALFSMGFESRSLLFLQVFLFVVSVPILALAVLIEERNSTENNLRESQEKLREKYEEVRYLAGKLITAQDDERRRIARELHDDVGQRLALVAVHLHNVEQSVPLNMVETHSSLLELKQETGEAATTLRELSHQLHSSSLQHLGLHAALKDLCRTVAQQHNILIEVETGKPQGSSDDVDLCLFRIAQEALSNIAKHSNATTVTVRLSENMNELCLEIADDGVGFDSTGPSTGLGLVSMRERVRFLNGTITVESTAMRGTKILARVPLRSQHRAAG